MVERGKFIVIYGANNLGKSAQMEFLHQYLQRKGKAVEVVKYPIYDLEPTGPIINAALRKGLSLSHEELQMEFAQNRRDYEPTLVKKLESGLWVLSEDYKGTGISWGVTYGVSLEKMEEMNAGLLDEDLAVLLYGEQITSGIERGHRHEMGGRWETANRVHRELAIRYGWHEVYANRNMFKVSNEIKDIVKAKLL